MDIIKGGEEIGQYFWIEKPPFPVMASSITWAVSLKEKINVLIVL